MDNSPHCSLVIDHWSLIIMSLLLGTACTGGAGRIPDHAGGNLPSTSLTESMPLLVPVPLPLDEDHDPPGPMEAIAVSPRGTLAFHNPRYRSDRFMLTIAAPATPPREIVRRGSGPGEIGHGSLRLRFLDTLLLADDREQARASLFSPHGGYLAGARVPFGWYLVGSTGDSLDYFSGHSPAGQAAIYRRAILGQKGRVLIAHDDSLLRRVAPHLKEFRLAWAPAYATTGQRSVLGDPMRYRLRYYDRGKPSLEFGREIPPRRRNAAAFERERRWITQQIRIGFVGPNGKRMALPGLQERLDTLDREVLPHFSRHGLAFDHAGRLWVIGETGDSAFADVFADTTFLGRIALSCRGPDRSISFNTRWLAMICLTPDGEPEIQLYRVADQQ